MDAGPGAQSVGGAGKSAVAADRHRPGIVERTVTRLFMRPAKVIAAESLSDNFRLIDFQSDALKECTWSPGDKVQVKLEGGFITRTYTPIMWNKAEGATRFLAYCHGSAPGSDWARHVGPGDERPFFGPRSSISLEALAPSTILFGDETSFALALALERSASTAGERRYVFEVNDRQEAAAVLEALELPAHILIERRSADAHLDEIGSAVMRDSLSETSFILTGKASSIQHVSRMLKGAGVETRALRTKAYWAPGKTGLD